MSHRYLILGLLAESPMTGYDIKKQVKSALSAVTNASYGTLYPTLHKLLLEGAIEVQEIPQASRPAKKVYHLTGKGRELLVDWLRQPPAADQVKREFLLKLYLAKDLPPDDLRNLLLSRRGAAEATLRSLRTELKLAKEDRQIWIIGYAVSQCQAEIDWLDQLAARMGVA